MGKVDKKQKALVREHKVMRKEVERRLEERDILNKETAGYLEADEGEKTLKFSQDQLKPHLQQSVKNNIFDLDLDHGPYCIDYSLNGSQVLLGGQRGHVAMLDWKSKLPICEFAVKERVRAVKFLQNKSMFAVAQKKYLYIYDDQGMELHAMKQHIEPKLLEFLPYHFLLASASKRGHLKYQDVTTGEVIAEMNSKKGEPHSLNQNPQNAILAMGHSYGGVSLWSPNFGKPLVQMICHPSSPVTSISHSADGHYMVTTGQDSKMKIWDTRTYKLLNTYFTQQPAVSTSISQSGLLSVAYGNEVMIWKDWQTTEKQKEPYMKHRAGRKSKITGCQFAPYEDFLGLGLTTGYSSIVVPGSGEANFDTFEQNPFQTAKQR